MKNHRDDWYEYLFGVLLAAGVVGLALLLLAVTR